jgi:hypothetical protein
MLSDDPGGLVFLLKLFELRTNNNSLKINLQVVFAREE